VCGGSSSSNSGSRGERSGELLCLVAGDAVCTAVQRRQQRVQCVGTQGECVWRQHSSSSRRRSIEQGNKTNSCGVKQASSTRRCLHASLCANLGTRTALDSSKNEAPNSDRTQTQHSNQHPPNAEHHQQPHSSAQGCVGPDTETHTHPLAARPLQARASDS
jgi:hypothetical protein